MEFTRNIQLKFTDAIFLLSLLKEKDSENFAISCEFFSPNDCWKSELSETIFGWCKIVNVIYLFFSWVKWKIKFLHFNLKTFFACKLHENAWKFIFGIKKRYRKFKRIEIIWFPNFLLGRIKKRINEMFRIPRPKIISHSGGTSDDLKKNQDSSNGHLARFSNETSLEAVSHCITAKSIVDRTIWVIISLGALGALTYHLLYFLQ